MSHITVLSVGGSIVAPDQVDTHYVQKLTALLRARVTAPNSERFALVIGGGKAARSYQEAMRSMRPDAPVESLDTIGIAATRLNASLVMAVLGDVAGDVLVTDPTNIPQSDAPIMVAGGWKPGFSTDNVAVVLAESVGASTLINLSNIKKVYTADPSVDSAAVPLDEITWDRLSEIVGTDWIPGKNTPFDPIATKRAATLGMTVIAADGRDIENLEAILDGRRFEGTTIHP